MKIIRLLPVIPILVWLSACSSLTKPPTDMIQSQSVKERQAQIKQLAKWQVKGRIAIIQGNERDSASLYWQVDNIANTQQLKLNTYLGIQVLSVESNGGTHKINVDGQEYQGQDLAELIQLIAGHPLPVEVLDNWLFGIADNNRDIISYDENTQLPTRLTAMYQGNVWHIDYDNYRRVNTVALANKVTITQNNLIIKIAIRTWTI